MEEAKVIRVPADVVISEYSDWIKEFQSESYLLAYTVNHAEDLFGQGVRLAGIEIVIPGKGRVDLVFKNADHYFIVEAKHTDEAAAKERAEDYAKGFEEHLRQNNVRYGQVSPIGIIMKYPKARGSRSRFFFERQHTVLPGGSLPIRYKTNIPYKSVASALKRGNDVSFSNLRRQTAHAAAKKLTGLVGEKVVAVPTVAEDESWMGYGFITEIRLKEQLKANGKVGGRGL